jgi:hypothetical protein
VGLHLFRKCDQFHFSSKRNLESHNIIPVKAAPVQYWSRLSKGLDLMEFHTRMCSIPHSGMRGWNHHLHRVTGKTCWPWRNIPPWLHKEKCVFNLQATDSKQQPSIWSFSSHPCKSLVGGSATAQTVPDLLFSHKKSVIHIATCTTDDIILLVHLV